MRVWGLGADPQRVGTWIKVLGFLRGMKIMMFQLSGFYFCVCSGKLFFSRCFSVWGFGRVGIWGLGFRVATQSLRSIGFRV